jgi:hypothetical protein
MGDDLNVRRPQWNMIFFFWKLEDDFNISTHRRSITGLQKPEIDIDMLFQDGKWNYYAHGERIMCGIAYIKTK